MPHDGAPQLGASRALDARRLRIGLIGVAVLGLAVGVAIAAFTGGDTMLSGVTRLPPGVLAIALGLDFVSWVGEGVTFASLAGLRGVRGALRGTIAYVGGGFPGLVTPFGSGAIPGWAYALTREGLSAGEAAAVLGARGLLTSLFFVTAGVVAIVFVPAKLAGSGAASLFALAALVGVLAVVATIVARPAAAAAALGRALSGRVSRGLLGAGRSERFADAAAREAERFAVSLHTLVHKRPRALLAALAGLLVSRLSLLAILPVLMTGLGWRGDFLPVIVTVVGVQALASGSPTPGGSGAVEVAMTAALSGLAPASIAGAAALLWRGITFYFDLLVGWALFARYLAKAAPRRQGATSTAPPVERSA